MTHPGYGRFVALDERDAPHLVERMAGNLPVSGERYGIISRLIARPGVDVAALGTAVLRKLCSVTGTSPQAIGAVVLSSRIIDVQSAAEHIADALHIDGPAHGVEQACSGFPAATQAAALLCEELQLPVAIVAAEIISPSINWEPGDGTLTDHHRARGQAAKLFGDGAAAVLVLPASMQPRLVILDAWSGEVPDADELIQKTPVENSLDPWTHVRSGITECMSMPGRRGLLLVRRAPSVMIDAVRASLAHARQSQAISAHVAAPTQLVPHQASGLILRGVEEAAAEAWNPAPKVWNCVSHHGNTVSASIPLALAQMQDFLPRDALVALPAVGAGGPGYRPDVLSTGCVLVRVGIT